MAYERTRLLSETEYERLDISPFLDEIEFLIHAIKLGATGGLLDSVHTRLPLNLFRMAEN